jgi:hypothetical protein
MLKTALLTVCACTVLATGYLSLSLAILRPPRANYSEWFTMATLIVAQSVFTMMAVSALFSGGWSRWLALAGGVAIMWAGAAWVRDTLAREHFEGYALVLGSILVLQGALTLVVFLRQRPVGVVTAPQR